jgi:YVTN family beta-propeller protein
MTMRVRASFLAVAVALPLFLVAVVASPAFAGHGHGFSGAAPGAVTCSFSGTMKFSPGANLRNGFNSPGTVKADLSGCATTNGLVAITSGKISGSLSRVPVVCFPDCTGTDPTASLSVKWGGSFAGGRARFSDSTITDTGTAAVIPTSGDVGLFVPGVDHSSTVTGSFASNGSYFNISTTETRAGFTSAEESTRGLKTLTITGTLTLRDIVAYVGNSGDNTVTPIDTATNTAGTPITVVGGDHGAIAITPNGATAYVADSGGTTVTPINTFTNTPGTQITVGNDPEGIAITPNGATAYVANQGDATVTPIDTATNTPGAVIHVGSYPEAIAITPNGATAYVATTDPDTVTPINTATNAAGTPITTGIGSYPYAIAITPDGATAYVVMIDDATVTPISTATNTAGTPISVGTPESDLNILPASYPYAIAITPSDGTAYVADSGDTNVIPVNTFTNTPGTPMDLSSVPEGIAITPNGATAYVGNAGDNTVTPINLATNVAGTPITVGEAEVIAIG